MHWFFVVEPLSTRSWHLSLMMSLQAAGMADSNRSWYGKLSTRWRWVYVRTPAYASPPDILSGLGSVMKRILALLDLPADVVDATKG